MNKTDKELAVELTISALNYYSAFQGPNNNARPMNYESVLKIFKNTYDTIHSTGDEK